MDALRVFLLICFIVIITLVAMEFVRKRRMASLVPARQFGLRLFIAFLFLVEIGMLLIATFWLDAMSPLWQIAFLTGALIVAFIMIAAAIIDVRTVLVNYLIERRRLFIDDSDDKRDE